MYYCLSMSYRKLGLKNTSQKFRDNIQYLQIALHPLWEKCFVKKYSSITLHCHYLISCYNRIWVRIIILCSSWRVSFLKTIVRNVTSWLWLNLGGGGVTCDQGDQRHAATGHRSLVGSRVIIRMGHGSARPDLSCSLSVNLWRVQW